MSPFLVAESLTVRYPLSRNSIGKHKEPQKPVLKNLSFSLEEGEFFALLGPSGCGKTTLLNTLAGILTPEEGRVMLAGEPFSLGKTPIGLIPQRGGLLPWKTLEENCLFSLGNKTESSKRELYFLCHRLGIRELLNRYPHSLSGGQIQRGALARALLLHAPLLLMDEPFGALDGASTHRAQELCLSLCRERAVTAIIVTHRPEEALFLAHRIGVMNDGGGFSMLLKNPYQGNSLWGKEAESNPELRQLQSHLYKHLQNSSDDHKLLEKDGESF